MEKAKAYFNDVYVELTQKTSWPSWADLQSSAVIVMVASLIIALIVYGMDSVFSMAMTNIYGILY
jgi:preprotein translocase subunit SecE